MEEAREMLPSPQPRRQLWPPGCWRPSVAWNRLCLQQRWPKGSVESNELRPTVSHYLRVNYWNIAKRESILCALLRAPVWFWMTVHKDTLRLPRAGLKGWKQICYNHFQSRLNMKSVQTMYKLLRRNLENGKSKIWVILGENGGLFSQYNHLYLVLNSWIPGWTSELPSWSCEYFYFWEFTCSFPVNVPPLLVIMEQIKCWSGCGWHYYAAPSGRWIWMEGMKKHKQETGGWVCGRMDGLECVSNLV